MPSKSKNKGSSYERQVAKYLTEHYGESFHRIPNSGAYIGGKNTHRRNNLDTSQTKSFKGDINAPDTWVHFNAEAKFYADFAFHQLFSESKQLEDWLEQLMTTSDPHDVNILFMKFNRKGSYVAVQANLDWAYSGNYFSYRSSKYGDWMIYSFQNFFTANSINLKSFSQSKSKTLLFENPHLDTTT